MLAVRRVKESFFDSLYTTLDSKYGDKKLYRLTKVSKRTARDLDAVKYIKDVDNKIKVEKGFIRKRCQSYFHKL